MASTPITQMFDPLEAPSSSRPSILYPFSSMYNRILHYKASFGLPNPGTVENLFKEVKATHLNNLMFDGARADIAKAVSGNPLFQVTHSFSLGSQVQPPSYYFGALYATDSVFMQGNVDHDGGLNGRFHRSWGSKNNTTKIQAQLSPQAGSNAMQIEQEYQGSDYTINLKALNPWPTDMSGVFMGSVLHSISETLALGVEYAISRPTPDMQDVSKSFLAKYTSPDKKIIASAQLQTMGVLEASYWQKLSDKVDVAADLLVIAAPQRRDAIATLGAKWDLRMSTFRAQVDSTLKISAFLEQRFTPAFAFTLAGEVDHLKNAAKIGVGVAIESSTLTPEEMNALMQQEGQQPPI